ERQPFDGSPAAERMIALLERVEPADGRAADRPTNWVSPKLEVGVRPGGGRGLFARAPIDRDELVAVWGGEIADWDAVMALPDRARELTVQVEEGLYLVPTRPVDAGDFLNHSCAPNAGMRGQVAVVAMRPIERGDELCI